MHPIFIAIRGCFRQRVPHWLQGFTKRFLATHTMNEKPNQSETYSCVTHSCKSCSCKTYSCKTYFCKTYFCQEPKSSHSFIDSSIFYYLLLWAQARVNFSLRISLWKVPLNENKILIKSNLKKSLCWKHFFVAERLNDKKISNVR